MSNHTFFVNVCEEKFEGNFPDLPTVNKRDLMH